MNWLELSEHFAQYLEADPKCKGKINGNGILRGHCPLPSHEDKQKSFAYFVQSAGYSCACGKGKASSLMDSLGWKHDGIDWKTAQPVHIATYDYRDEDGLLLFQVTRFCPKKFYHRRPDGNGGFIDDIEGVRKVLYRLPELSLLEPGSKVLIVDGEKDVETAYNLGMPATCCSSGMHNWQDNYAAQFKDLMPTIIADKDADDSGRKAAKKVKESLKAAGIDANIIEMPGPMPPIKDLTDWVSTGETLESLKRLLSAGPISLLRSKIETLASLADLIDAPVDYVISPLAIKKCITLFQGLPKGGKSTFVLYLSICCSMDQWEAPNILAAKNKRRVLYIPYEDARQLLVQRAAKYVAGMGHPYRTLPTDLDIIYRPEIWFEDPKYGDALIEIVKTGGYDLLVLDTLSYVHRSNENEASEMVLPMYHIKRVAEDANVALIYIHHVSKSAEGKAIQNKGRGSGAITAAADIIVDWGDRGKTDISPVEIRSKWDDDLTFNVEYKKNADECKSVSWILSQSEDEDIDYSQKIINVLMAYPKGLTSGQLKELSGIPERTFYRCLENMKDKRVSSKADGRTVLYTFKELKS